MFANWFCRLANAILRLSKDDASTDELQPKGQCPNKGAKGNPTTKSQSPSDPRALSWLSCCNATLPGLGDPQIRPDFALTSTPTTPTWSTILVVGEHTSVGKTEETVRLQLASYAEQVFIVQPFRTAIIGIITSNTSSCLRLWRFDRAGAVGSLKLNYLSTDTFGGLISVVQSLYALTRRELHETWFHTESVSWTDPDWQAFAEPRTQDADVVLKKRIFTAGDIVTRGKCVWEGSLRATGAVVAVKYSWQSTKRTP